MTINGCEIAPKNKRGCEKYFNEYVTTFILLFQWKEIWEDIARGLWSILDFTKVISVSVVYYAVQGGSNF